MRWAASTSAKVNVGSSPSGTMATMMPIEKMKSFQKGMPIIAAKREERETDQHRENCGQAAQVRDLPTQR